MRRFRRLLVLLCLDLTLAAATLAGAEVGPDPAPVAPEPGPPQAATDADAGDAGEPSDPRAGGSGLMVSMPPALELPEFLPRVPTVDLTNDAIDVWDRIRRGFGMPDLVSADVDRQEIAYLSHPAYLDRAFERARPFLYHIVAELEERGMPTELALLPMVESAYNPRAYSRSRAAGLWQFIPSTARVFKLEQNAWVDERRDVVASTDAALDYLQYIYERHGDWHLALASYNWGEGAVARALRKNREAGKPEEYAHLRMPNETRLYVPKLQALKNIVAQPELYGIALPYVANKTHFDTIDSPPGIDLATAAAFADISLEEFVELNPAFKRPVIPDGTQPIVLPADRIDTFRANLALSGDAATRWRSYSVRRADTLSTLASRFGSTPTVLAEVNGISVRARLRPGSTLLVPVGDDPESALRAARVLPDEPKLKKRRRRVRKRH